MGRYEMAESRLALATKNILLGFFVILLMSAPPGIWRIFPVTGVLCDTYDDDTVVQFYWDAASGNVDHYNVYVSVYNSYGDPSSLAETKNYQTPDGATPESPYALPADVVIEDGKGYRLQVEAEDASGIAGPMSEPSDLVWCKLRSLGDPGSDTKGDADGNLRVGAGDWAIMCLAWDTGRGNDTFDYRADFNYDDIINILDLSIIGSSWGEEYGTGAPINSPFPPLAKGDEGGFVASGSRCKIELIGQENIRVGDDNSIDIVIEGAKDIYAIDFEVSFDPALVKVEGIEQGAFFSPVTRHASSRDMGDSLHSRATGSWIAGEISTGDFSHPSRGRISPTLAAVPLGSSTGRSGNGVIATLKLAAISGGVSSISLKNIHAYDSKLNAVAVTPIGAALTIEAAKYLLAQNYPNPFNPETWIPYALAEECDMATIVIYSVLGEEIRRLDLGHRNAGFYTTRDRAAYWDGKNEDGTQVASGVYFYQIKADDFSAVRKMVVLK
jgi:hypothetical protein